MGQKCVENAFFQQCSWAWARCSLGERGLLSGEGGGLAQGGRAAPAWGPIRGGAAVKAECVRRLGLPGTCTWSPFQEGFLHSGYSAGTVMFLSGGGGGVRGGGGRGGGVTFSDHMGPSALVCQRGHYCGDGQ